MNLFRKKETNIVWLLHKNINYLLIILFVITIIFLTIHFKNKEIQQDSVILQKDYTLPVLSHNIDLDFSFLQDDMLPIFVTNVWWKFNIIENKWDSLYIQYPEWSHSPSWSLVWGAGFIQHFTQGMSHIKLEYTLHFDENFDFVKWWKLPGLCGWTCPRGWWDTKDGFSTRFMWRKNWELEVYAYLPKKQQIMWESIGRGMFQFEVWRDYRVAQEIVLNTPWEPDGILLVEVDGKRVYFDDRLEYRSIENLKIDALLFATFFGWSDSSWSTPVDTWVLMKDFTLYY